ncbi:MAG: endopeptidase La [Lachnospiraceae bacterium]|nr:endopeptidase La [Lachnospiraceae bacterium]
MINIINKDVPVVPLRGLVVLPGQTQHFDAERIKSLAAIEAAAVGDEIIFLAAQRDPAVDDPEPEEIYEYGTLARIKQVIGLPQTQVRVTVEGLYKARITDVVSTSPYLFCSIEIYDGRPGSKDLSEDERGAMVQALQEIVDKYSMIGIRDPNSSTSVTMENLEEYVDKLCTGVPMSWQQAQKLLECGSFRDLYMELVTFLNKEYNLVTLNIEIQRKVKEAMDKNQREYVLREQMKAIRQELGEEHLTEAEEYEERLKTFRAPAIVKEKLKKEIDRLRLLGNVSSESSVYRNYIETIFEIPWSRSSRENKDLDQAEEVLRADHYGLNKVKERILEYLSVRILTGHGKSPILCLVGPPGTGKTSIAKSIARATSRKYVRISLGGLHDEAEIRGHRKTYIGAQPGRIATALQHAGVNNPVILLDEIDKVGADYRGDAYSAMLEVLDPEQNVNFRDNFLEVPLDLSKVLFICTANTLAPVPRPLLDRMEVIEVNTYTENEKLHIAREHLIAKQMETNGIKKGQLVITDKAIEEIILSYTRESGVRELERQIGEICRKTARKIIQGGKKRVRVTEKNLEEYLGKAKFSYDKKNEKNEIGIVRGLAWTSVGGETLSVEVNVLPGKGNFELTGQLGDVMKESAHAGISYIRSMISKYGVGKEFFEKNDMHIHIPEGAVPKDGPSAGVTMATAMFSAILGIPVRADVAMTGEITLRGRVLPIGGLREKIIAAKVAGINTVIVPEKNRPDIEELDAEIREGMKIIYAGTMADILPIALEHMPEEAQPAK